MRQKHPLRSDRVNKLLQTEEGRKAFITNVILAKDRANIPPFRVGNKTITVRIIGTVSI